MGCHVILGPAWDQGRAFSWLEAQSRGCLLIVNMVMESEIGEHLAQLSSILLRVQK